MKTKTPRDAHDDQPRFAGRRSALRQAAAVVGTLGTAAALSAAAVDASAGAKAHRDASGARTLSTAGRSSPSIAAGTGIAEAQTTAGKVAGYLAGDIYTFKGIPYADSPAGANRFLPPRAPKPWSGVRASRAYGPVCHQGDRMGRAADEQAFLFDWDDGYPGEDCLRINVWTPGLRDGRKRPIMLWIHGGGFSTGSSQELRSYDGERLARRGDVVVMSLNHRLNAFGYLDLSAYGEQFAQSGNAGMLDIVAALHWVRDNGAAFGGDPGCVTIFGQSGGAAKVNTLLAMPGARGLFHRAIVQSWPLLRVATPDFARSMTADLLAELNITGNPVERLQALPAAQLAQAGVAVRVKRFMARAANPAAARNSDEFTNWAPVMDGVVLPHHPYDPVVTPNGAAVPLMIGTTLNEFVTAIDHPELEAMSDAELEKKVAGTFGAEHVATIIRAFRKRTPQAKAFDLWSRISTAPFRGRAVQQARLHAAGGLAPAYLYWFTWQTPILDGRPRAFHCAELAFAFDNTERCRSMTGDGEEARALAVQVSEAWIHFARTGNPNHPGLPKWAPVDQTGATSMIFDRRCEALVAPDAEELAAVAT